MPMIGVCHTCGLGVERPPDPPTPGMSLVCPACARVVVAYHGPTRMTALALIRHARLVGCRCDVDVDLCIHEEYPLTHMHVTHESTCPTIRAALAHLN